MSGDDEDYVYDEDSGEWLPAAELAAKRANTRGSSRLYCWQEEEEMLLAMYRALGFDAGGDRHAPR